MKKLHSKIATIMETPSKVWYTVEESPAGGSRKFDQTKLLIGQAFNPVPYSRRTNALIGVGTEKVKAKNTIKNQVSLLEENSRKLFSKSFRKHMITTAKAKKESKEVYWKNRVNNSEKSPFRKILSLQKQNGGTICITHNVEVQ